MELIPGRVLLLMLDWHNDQRLTILTIHAPNSPHAHPQFWSEIENKINDNPHRPDLLLGDFNIIEDAMDRAPAHEDYEPLAVVDCLRDLHNAIGIQDTWHLENPTTCMYTSAGNANSLSRLD